MVVVVEVDVVLFFVLTPFTLPVSIGSPPLVVAGALGLGSGVVVGLAEPEGVGVGEEVMEGDVEGVGFKVDMNLVVALKV